MQENFPFLVSVKPLNADFAKFNKIPITSQQFTLGRALDNAVVIAFLAISRKHCIFKKINDTDWTIEDFSAFGIHVNNVKMKKGIAHKLSPNDTIQLDATGEFVYRFTTAGDDDDYLESPPKRIKLEQEAEIDLIKDVKMKFAESQSFKVRNIEDRIQCAKDLQNTSLKQKQELEAEMETKMKKLKDDFAIQIENLKGEKSEVEKQKQLLENERDLQIENVRNKMGDKINELMEQIQKHNETEEELLKENAELKNKLLKEREDFLEELNRETSSKQELLKQLEDKIKEQEELRMQEREKTERLQQEKEKELKELEDQKKQRELELKQELNQLKENLTSQVTHIESEKLKAEKEMNEKMEQMKKLSEEDKLKMEQLQKERAEAEKKLMEAQQSAKISLEALSKQVQERETQLAALAADRIQKHAEQSGVVITSLQEQLEKVKSELQSVETEKNTLLESICHSVGSGEGTSTKEATLLEVGELMESELQCSICSELFMCATTLNCSHTFCRYCIGQWKKKKLECPICRATITSECKSLVLDSFIEKMVEMSTEMKNKRASMLKDREETERKCHELADTDASGESGGGESYDGESSDDGLFEDDFGYDDQFQSEFSEEEYDFEDFLQY